MSQPYLHDVVALEAGPLLALVGGYIVTQSLYTAAVLGLADQLAQGSLRNWVLLNGSLLYRTFAEMPSSLESGRPATEKVLGQGLFEHLESAPQDAAMFHAAMADFTHMSEAGLVAACDLSASRHVVDVGGGSGGLLAAFLRANPNLEATLLDRQHALDGARRTLKEAGVEGRCTLVAGDFFEAVPAGGDIYVLSWILHDWDDATAATVLANVRNAISADGRLLVIESVLPGGDTPDISRFLDVVMLVALGGQERDEWQYRALLAEAGFRFVRIIATGGPRSVIEARPY